MPIRNARETFISGPHKAELEKIVQTAAFEVACHTALLALVEESPQTFLTPEASWQNGVHLAGARRVLEILAALPFPQQVPKRPTEKTLNYSIQ